MKQLIVFSWLSLLLIPGLSAQSATLPGAWNQLDLPLQSLDRLSLPADQGDIRLHLVAGDALRLIPPDMAQLAPSRLRSMTVDTLPAAQGLARCLARCRLDTLFLAQGAFLLDVAVEVPYFVDGTYEGQSTFGWEILREMGRCEGPQVDDQGQPWLQVAGVPAGNFTPAARAWRLQAFEAPPGFALQPGDLEEIRLIRGSDQPSATEALAAMQALLQATPQYAALATVDPDLPPLAARQRLQRPLTIRFFEARHQARAEALAGIVAFLLDVPGSAIRTEDMQPFYGGNVPRSDYLEVWFQ